LGFHHNNSGDSVENKALMKKYLQLAGFNVE